MLWAAIIGEGGVITALPDHPSIPSLLRLGEQLGAESVLEGSTVDILARGAPDFPATLSCQKDAFLSRLLVPFSLLSGLPSTLTDVRLPIAASLWLDGAASSLGTRILKTSSRLEVNAPPEYGGLDLSERTGAFWAPYMLMAAPYADLPLMFSMDEFVFSQPSVRMTISAMEKMGIAYATERGAPAAENDTTLTFAPNQSYAELNAEVEADWRTGSYLAGALMLSGSGSLELPSSSVQAERNFWAHFEKEGIAQFNPSGDTLSIRSPGAVLPIPSSWDLRAHPALYPLALVLATRAQASVCLEPLYPISPRARERLHSTIIQLARLGADISTTEGFIEVRPSVLEGGEADCNGDARVAMALGLAGLISRQPVSISGAEAVSYVSPAFWSNLRNLGADVRIDYTRVQAPAFSPLGQKAND